MLNETRTTKKNPPKPKQYFFGEQFVNYLNVIAGFELFCGIISSIFIFMQTDDISDVNAIGESFKNFGNTISIVIFISSFIIYFLLISLKHILNNSIENRKLLLKLTNNINKKD